MQPMLTLADIFGAEVIYNPRVSYRHYGWLATDIDFCDALTGGALTVAGAIPTICSRAVLTPAAMELLAAAGLPKPPRVIPYGTEGEYEQRLKDAAQSGRRLVFQHVHAPNERPDSLYWVPPALLAVLNNKASLPDLVPAEHVPVRRLVTLADLPRLAAQTRRQPLVLKAASLRSNSGGRAVVIARDPADVLAASQRLAPCEQVVVEQFLEIRKNYCLNFATVSGAIRYLGGSEQVTDNGGRYGGNWLGSDGEPPRLAIEVGSEIMRRAVARGYRGVAGFDIVVDRDGVVKVIDLNFRLNGSTPSVLWRSAGGELFNRHRVARFQPCCLPGPLTRLLPRLRRLIDAGELLPLMVFDPAECPCPAGRVYLQVLWFGQSRQEVEAKQNEMASWFRSPIIRAASNWFRSRSGRRETCAMTR